MNSTSRISFQLWNLILFSPHTLSLFLVAPLESPHVFSICSYIPLLLQFCFPITWHGQATWKKTSKLPVPLFFLIDCSDRGDINLTLYSSTKQTLSKTISELLMLWLPNYNLSVLQGVFKIVNHNLLLVTKLPQAFSMLNSSISSPTSSFVAFSWNPDRFATVISSIHRSFYPVCGWLL